MTDVRCVSWNGSRLGWKARQREYNERVCGNPFVSIIKEGKGFKQRGESSTVVFLKDPSGSEAESESLQGEFVVDFMSF